MQQILAYLGPAGSGKTFDLMKEVKRISTTTSLRPTQAILAITFMHGSRRRLAERLREFTTKEFSTQCDTIDSFCLQLVNRFRRYIGKMKPIAIRPDLASDDWTEELREWKTTFGAVRIAAIKLLTMPVVRSSIAAAFPIIIVDEFQDCDGDLLEVVGLLGINSRIILAADEFQYLSIQEECPARIWLNGVDAEIVSKSDNQRTSVNELRETASALREGRQAAHAIAIHPIAPGLAAWQISSQLSWGKIPAGKSKAIICPARPSSSKWLQSILDSLCKELGQSSKVGPNPFKWDGGEQEQLAAATALFDAGCGASTFVDRALIAEFESADNHIVRMAARQARRLLGLRGDDSVPKSEFTDILQRISHSTSAFRREQHNARLAMTVHGAKNREFDYVFIAWPYEVSGESLLARKLLYNAVTRAKVAAVLFVQGDEKRIRTDKTLALLQCGIVQRDEVVPKKKKKRP